MKWSLRRSGQIRPADQEQPGTDNVVLNQIGGIATVFYSSIGPERARFIGLLHDFYPWSKEQFTHDENIDSHSGPPILYDVVRNPFTHSLGIETQTLGGDRGTKRIVRRFRGKDFHIGVSRLVSRTDGAGLSEELLQELEADRRPRWLPPTIMRAETAAKRYGRQPFSRFTASGNKSWPLLHRHHDRLRRLTLARNPDRLIVSRSQWHRLFPGEPRSQEKHERTLP